MDSNSPEFNLVEVDTFPPNYRDLVDTLNAPKDAIFCYGDTIHNPSKKEIPLDVRYHEYIHSKQQSDNIDVWWYNYINDKEFRFLQEVEAYGEQYKLAKENVKDKKLLDWALGNMAEALASNYKLDISIGEAESKIRNHAKKK